MVCLRRFWAAPSHAQDFVLTLYSEVTLKNNLESIYGAGDVICVDHLQGCN